MNYDVFLSHSHMDKVWTRELYDCLAKADYNGRNVRAWLDAHVLDPGDLSSARELESAVDRSRRIALVLTPESLASDWVQHEIGYFLKSQPADDVALIRRRPCDIPASLANSPLIEWPESEEGKEQLERLLGFLRPNAGEYEEYNHRRAVRRAWENAGRSQPAGLDPTHTEENTELLDLLLSYDINHLDEEGLALAGFDRVGQMVAEMDATERYGAKMVLGEFLAVAVLGKPSYAQVAASYVAKDIQTGSRPSFLTLRNRALRGKTRPPSATNLLFAVARSGSKLAEIDPSNFDLSTMAALLRRLDLGAAIGSQEKLVASMVGRALGKLRNTVPVDALLHALINWGGNASHIAVAAALSSTLDERDQAYYFTLEFERLAADRQAKPSGPPEPRIAWLLLDPDSRLRGNLDIKNEVNIALADLEKVIGTGQTGSRWPELQDAPRPTRLENGPLVGTVRRVTLANMESFAERLGPTEIACLTEPRIVDALLGGAGGYLIDDQQADDPLGIRLRTRGARFASYGCDTLNRFEDGSVVALWPRSDGSSPAGYVVQNG